MVQLSRKRKAARGPDGQRATGQKATFGFGRQTKESQKELERVKGELKQARERCSKMEILTKLSNLLNSSLDFAYVKKKAITAATELLDCEASSLLLKDEKGKLFFEVALGEKARS